jgi:hypothetical protein
MLKSAIRRWRERRRLRRSLSLEKKIVARETLRDHRRPTDSVPPGVTGMGG